MQSYGLGILGRIVSFYSYSAIDQMSPITCLERGLGGGSFYSQQFSYSFKKTSYFVIKQFECFAPGAFSLLFSLLVLTGW